MRVQHHGSHGNRHNKWGSDGKIHKGTHLQIHMSLSEFP